MSSPVHGSATIEFMTSLQEVRVDRAAYRHNLETILQRVQPAKVLAVLKANAYGHGAVELAKAADQTDVSYLGVVSLEEALRLRKAGIGKPIIAWLHLPGTDFTDAARHDITLGLSTADQIEAAAAAGARTVHLAIDTGLGRNGATRAQWPHFFETAARLQAAGQIDVEGMMSHLSNTSVDDDTDQLHVFDDALQTAAEYGIQPRLRHIAATGVALDRPEARYDMVRIGIGSYGLSPDERTSADLGLTPVMRVSTQVAQIKRVPEGTPASYGYLYRAPGETTFALVPFGYADGLPRQASEGGGVLVGGKIYPVAGRIAMDQFVIDVGDDDVHIGDEAVILGDPERGEPSATLWAESAGTINYEIVTRIGDRPQRVYVDQDGADQNDTARASAAEGDAESRLDAADRSQARGA